MLCRRLAVAFTTHDSVGRSLRRAMGSSAVVVCADFDQTITTRDTIALLFDAATAKRTDRDAHQRQVQQLVRHYVDEASTLTSFALTEGNNTPQRFNEDGLRAFLSAFAAVDLQSIRRVIESETLKGLQHRDLEAIGETVDVMERSVEVLAMASRAVVISSNWSGAMIREKLRRCGLATVDVIANELKMDHAGTTTGEIELIVQSPTDKATIVEKQKASSDALVVFIGDSTNDLLGMLQADIGITLGFAVGSTFTRVCQQYGIQLVPLSKFQNLTESRDYAQTMAAVGQRVLFTASCWNAIHSRLLATLPVSA